jgi:hypothetical protein
MAELVFYTSYNPMIIASQPTTDDVSKRDKMETARLWAVIQCLSRDGTRLEALSNNFLCYQ